MNDRKLVEDLIEALQIASKYMEEGDFPTHCEHDVMYLCVEPDQLSAEDRERLEELGFHEFSEFGCLQSFRFGSA